MYYLKILRPVNLLLIALMMCLVKYGFLERTDLPFNLDTPRFVVLLLATLCIAAAGNIINDIYDQSIDAINKPKKRVVGLHISENTANYYYIILNVLGVLLGFYVANMAGVPAFALVFIITSALLYWYAVRLKKVLIAGNILISFLVGLTIILFLLFDLVPSFNGVASAFQIVVSKILLLYAAFAFVVNFIREIVKDILDVNGDQNNGVKSIPIVMGCKRATQVVFVLAIGFALVLVYLMYTEWYTHSPMMIYFLLMVIAPLFLFIIKAYDAEKPKDYKLLSLLLKVILFTGTGSIIFYPQLLTITT